MADMLSRDMSLVCLSGHTPPHQTSFGCKVAAICTDACDPIILERVFSDVALKILEFMVNGSSEELTETAYTDVRSLPTLENRLVATLF